MTPRPPDRPLGLEALVRRLMWLVPLGLAGNVIYTLLATDREALRATVELQPPWLATAVALGLVPLALNAVRIWRWGRILRPGYGFRDAVRVVLLGEVGAAVTPSALGATPMKVASLARQGFGTTGGMTVAALGGVEDGVAIGILIPLLASVTGLLPRFLSLLRRLADAALPGQGLVVAGAVLLALGAVIWLLLRGARGRRRRVRIRRWLREQMAVLRLVRRHGPLAFLGNLGVAVVQWSARLSIVTAVAAGLGAPLEPLRAVVLQWLCFASMSVTPTPGAIGGAEAAFAVVFGRELPAGLTPVAMSAWRLVTFYALNMLAVVLLLGPLRERQDRRTAVIERHDRCGSTAC